MCCGVVTEDGNSCYVVSWCGVSGGGEELAGYWVGAGDGVDDVGCCRAGDGDGAEDEGAAEDWVECVPSGYGVCSECESGSGRVCDGDEAGGLGGDGYGCEENCSESEGVQIFI